MISSCRSLNLSFRRRIERFSFGLKYLLAIFLMLLDSIWVKHSPTSHCAFMKNHFFSMLIVDLIPFSLNFSSSFHRNLILFSHLPLKKFHKINLIGDWSLINNLFMFVLVHLLIFKRFFFCPYLNSLTYMSLSLMKSWLFSLFERNLFFSLGFLLVVHFFDNKVFIIIFIYFFCIAIALLTAHSSSCHFFLQQLKSLLGFKDFTFSHVNFQII